MYKSYGNIDKKLLNERINKLMEENKLTEEQLIDNLRQADLLISGLFYDRYVKSLDKPVDDETVCNIAKYFKIHPDYLFGYSNRPHEYFMTQGKTGENFGRTLRELRTKKGFEPYDVACNVDISLNAYLRIEDSGDEPTRP